MCAHVLSLPSFHMSRATPILVSVLVSGQYQHNYFDGIRIGKVHYTGIDSFAFAILTMKCFFKVIKLK